MSRIMLIKKKFTFISLVYTADEGEEEMTMETAIQDASSSTPCSLPCHKQLLEEIEISFTSTRSRPERNLFDFLINCCRSFFFIFVSPGEWHQLSYAPS